MLGPELQQSLGTTAILSGPRANWEPCNQWRREDPLGRGLECRGQPPASLLRRAAAGLGPSAPPHPHPRLLPASGRPGKAGPAAALSSRSPGGSEPAGLWGKAPPPTSKPAAPPDPVAEGAGEPGGRQVWADSPFIPLIGGRRPPGGPVRPCRACPYRAWRQGERRGRGGREGPEAAAARPGRGNGASILSPCLGFPGRPPHGQGSPGPWKILGKFLSVWTTDRDRSWEPGPTLTGSPPDRTGVPIVPFYRWENLGIRRSHSQLSSQTG